MKRPLRRFAVRLLQWYGWHLGPKEHRMDEYVQTWWVVSRLKRFWKPIPIHRFFEWLCDVFIGHELSKTEWGYGGGGIDRWCRWCDKLITIPKLESICPPIMQELVDGFDDGTLPNSFGITGETE